MKITDRFLGDHKTFRKLINDIEAIPHPIDDAGRRRLVRLIELFVDHLILHAWGEETFYYPAVAQVSRLSETLTPSYLQLLDEEHAAVDAALQEAEVLVKRIPFSDEWKQKYDVFKRGLLAHMRKEEEELFPLSERFLGADALEKISADLEKRRTEAPPIRRHASF